jgi:hypothetical protein
VVDVLGHAGQERAVTAGGDAHVLHLGQLLERPHDLRRHLFACVVVGLEGRAVQPDCREPAAHRDRADLQPGARRERARHGTAQRGGRPAQQPGDQLGAETWHAGQQHGVRHQGVTGRPEEVQRELPVVLPHLGQRQQQAVVEPVDPPLAVDPLQPEVTGHRPVRCAAHEAAVRVDPADVRAGHRDVGAVGEGRTASGAATWS